MLDKEELLHQLTRQQSRLTFDLTDWLLSRFGTGEADALVQRWAGLLVQSLLESLRRQDPQLVADFMVVLRGRGQALYDGPVWRAGLHWLGCRCHRLLKAATNQPSSLAASKEPLEDLRYQQWEELTGLLNDLDRAIHLGMSELATHRVRRPILLQLGILAPHKLEPQFNLN